VLRLLKPDQIDWLEADGHYVRIRADGEDLLVRERLRSFERELDPGQFIRIHRSTIVNVERVRELRHWFGGDYQVFLRDGTELRLSRSYRRRLTRFTLDEAADEEESPRGKGQP
jgi:two-component system LytT family response regulator